MTSSTASSARGVPDAYGNDTAFSAMSMPPASAATASACSATARSSSASTSATSAASPMSFATASSRALRAAGEVDAGAGARERPRDGAADRPAAAVDHRGLVLQHHPFSFDRGTASID